MSNFKYLHRELSSLRATTELLEALDWDERKLADFLKELEVLLMAAPPSVSKALFWIRSTPWETFNRDVLPLHIYEILEKSFLSWEKEMKAGLQDKENRSVQLSLFKKHEASTEDDWN